MKQPGTVDKYTFEAKLFDEGSIFGIKNGRVSKLGIMDEQTCIVSYDRGWDIRPKKSDKPYYNAVMSLLESAPKRFSE